MTIRYLSMKQGVNLPGIGGTPTVATSGPTADVIVELGALVPLVNLSRGYVLDALTTIMAYIRADDPSVGGTNALTLFDG